MKQDSAYHILRVGMGMTFLWIGVLIFRDPTYWGGFLQPWAAGLLPIPLKEAMIGTAVLDAFIGIFLLIDSWVWIAALLGTIHLVIVLATSGIDVVTVRDIGLLTGCFALFWSALPASIKNVLKKKARTEAPHEDSQQSTP